MSLVLRRSLLALGAMLAVLGSIEMVAQASDDSAYVKMSSTGSRCVEDYATSEAYYYGMSIENNSSTVGITVYCPVEVFNTVAAWDYTSSNLVSHHTNLKHVWTAIVDDNSSGDVSCYLRVCNLDYTSCDTGSSATASSNSVEPLDGETDTVGSDDNIAFLVCTLPKKAGSNRSEIRSYSVESY